MIDNRNVSVSTIFQRHTEHLTYAICPVLYGLTNTINAEDLISLETKDMIVNVKETELQKANQLVIILQTQIKSREKPYGYVKELCNAFKKFGNKEILDIANTILNEIGNCYITDSMLNIIILTVYDYLYLISIIL